MKKKTVIISLEIIVSLVKNKMKSRTELSPTAHVRVYVQNDCNKGK